MQNHNEYLKVLEHYLSDLSVMQRVQLISEANAEISNKELTDLQDAPLYANIKRQEHGFIPFQEKKKFSLFNFFLKITAFFSILMISLVFFFVWKFTPLLKVDEKNNRVIILGGLIDIDGKSGKYKILDQYNFAEDHFTNDLQANIALPSDKDEIIVHFSSGSYTLKNSKDNEFKLDCKLAKPAGPDIIQQMDDLLKIDLTQVGGSTCELRVPEDKKLTLEGKESAINVLTPEFNLYIELGNGKVAITPEEEIDYIYSLENENGDIGEFSSSKSEAAYEIQVRLGSGAIIRK